MINIVKSSLIPRLSSMRTWERDYTRSGSPFYIISMTRMRITDHLDHQQQGIDALPDLLSGQFSMDPSVISEVNSYNFLTVEI